MPHAVNFYGSMVKALCQDVLLCKSKETTKVSHFCHLCPICLCTAATQLMEKQRNWLVMVLCIPYTRLQKVHIQSKYFQWHVSTSG